MAREGEVPTDDREVAKGIGVAFRAEDGAKIYFGHYEVQPLVPLTVFFGKELDLINQRDRGAWVW